MSNITSINIQPTVNALLGQSLQMSKEEFIASFRWYCNEDREPKMQVDVEHAARNFPQLEWEYKLDEEGHPTDNLSMSRSNLIKIQS
jgi:hypothetical protein